MQTPKTKTSNESQKVRKSIDPVDEISIKINRKSNKKELNCLLTGISHFIDTFENGTYDVDIKISKVIEDVSVDDKKSNNTSDKEDICTS